jgi:hypothetical protein
MSLSLACATLTFCGCALFADTPLPLPQSNPMPKPAPLILLVDGPDATSSPVPVDRSAPEAAADSAEVAADPIIVALPTPVAVDTNTAAVAAKKGASKIDKIWALSIAAVLGGTTMDAVSSWGKAETNPLLRSANGTFGARGLLIKGGLAGAMIAPEFLLRNNEEAKKKLAIVNFVAAGVFSAVVLHNFTIPKAP